MSAAPSCSRAGKRSRENEELIDIFMVNVQLVVREQALISGVSVTDASRVIFCYSKFDSEISCLWDL